MTLKNDAKFKEKLTCGLENDVTNWAKFHQSTRKCQNWDSDGILLSKVENVTEKLCAITIKNDVKFEEELTYHFKIDMRNLMNFYPSTQKSKKFPL